MSKEATIRIRGYCIDCGKGLPGHHSKRCKKCYIIYRTIHPDRKKYARDWHIKKKNGLDPEEFDVYWIACRGLCFICNKPMVIGKAKGTYNSTCVVDHNHKTGVVRGLLCGQCNKALGGFKDNIQIMKKAIIYLGGIL